jgi:hypothetical protein
MVMVVADAILEERCRPGRLNTPDESLRNEDAERVIDGLQRDGANLGSDRGGHAVGSDVRLSRYRSQHSQSLSGNLNAAFTKQVRRVRGHHRSISSV